MNHSISFKYFLKEDVTRGLEQKIYGRIRVNRKKAEFSTNFYVKPELWDEARGRCKANTYVNEDLIEIEAKINRIRRKLEDDDKPISAQAIALTFKGKKKARRYLLEYMDEHVLDMREMGEHAINTINHYTSTRTIFEAYIKRKFKTKDYAVEEIDYAFIKGFDLYLMSVHRNKQGKPIKRNTANKHHTRLRTFTLKAQREGLLNQNPYDSFKLKNTPSSRTFLTQTEIDLIRDLDLYDNYSLDRVRDFFLFSCYTSLRYKDAFNLTMDDIIETSNGKRIISIKMDKTHEMVYVPLIDDALNIIDKYEAEEARQIKGYVLPRYTNQKLNVYLKHIGTIAGIKKEMSHHVARHTFATVALNNGIPLEVVQKLLGHNNMKTTQIYAKMLTSTLEREMEKFKL